MSKDSETPQYDATVVQLGRGRRGAARTRSLTSRNIPSVGNKGSEANGLVKQPKVQSIPVSSLEGTTSYQGAEQVAHATVEELNIGTQSLLDAALLQSSRSFDDVDASIPEGQLTPEKIKKQGIFSKKSRSNTSPIDERLDNVTALPTEPRQLFKRRSGFDADDQLQLAAKKKKQQKTFLVAGSLLCLMSFTQFLFGGGDEVAGVHASTLIGSRPGSSKLANPEISWVEYYLCRGRAKSPFCNTQVKHPFVDKWQDVGHKMNKEDRAHTVKSLRETFYTPDRAPHRY